MNASVGAALFLLLHSAQAATIINIQAYTDASSTGSGVSNPNTAVGDTETFTNAVTLNLAAGDYLLSDAWGQAGALYDAWNFETSVGGSWTSHFSVGAYQSGSADSALYTLLIDGNITPGPGHFGGYDTEAEASSVFLATAPFKLHLDTATKIGFAAPDYYLPDNLGGISLAITSASVGPVTSVPEPSEAALLMAGLGGLLALRCGRRSRADR